MKPKLLRTLMIVALIVLTECTTSSPTATLLTATSVPSIVTPPPPTETPTLTPLPPLSGSGGVIAFVSERDGIAQIYIMNADGGDLRYLTRSNQDQWYPHWSPDGEQIVFHSHQGSAWSIYTVEAQGGDVQRLTDENTRDAGPVWSPDGTRIAFDRDSDLWIMNADGSDQRQLTDDPGIDGHADWSPDGLQIALTSERDGNTEIYVMAVPDGTDVDGSDLRRLTHDDAGDWWPDWSPDGTQIAFKSNRDGDFEIYVVNVDGADLRQLTDNTAEDGEPDWSPDGAQIVFESNRDGNFDIYVMDADGGNVQRLTDHPTRDIMPTWRPVATVASPAEVATLGDTWTRPADEMVMVYVPDGEFQMGSDDAEVDAALEMCNTHYGGCERAWFEVEQPAHTVELDGFWIDQTEVTNGQYQQCVEAGACDPPRETSSDTRSTYYGDGAYDDYPVVNVNWHQADGYCAWTGGRLPTEAEWEYAARGPEGHRYPWGNEFDGTRLNSCDVNCEYSWAEEAFDDGYADTAPVGSYPSGASWCGALDLAGNVWEWMADWFWEYSSGGQVNPTGPSSGTSHTLRGDSADGTRSVSRCAARHGMPASQTYKYTGFRCIVPPGE